MVKRNQKILEVDRFFPSSKTCHVCLNQLGSLPLDVRTWTCSGCNTTHDRDINAAISLRDEGLRLLAVGYGEPASPCRTTALASGTGAQSLSAQVASKRRLGGSPPCAYRPDVRPSSGGRKKSTL